ncbi:MAG: permease, partial [Planctomycetota bacterium]
MDSTDSNMIFEYFGQVISDFWATIAEMSPYLLFGFFVAGILSVLISQQFVERHLAGRGIWPLIKASVAGVPLPLCSCGVIPVAMSLRKHGANRGAT